MTASHSSSAIENNIRSRRMPALFTRASKPPKVSIASWTIAFIEYVIAVPANRIGHRVYSAAELKTMQEVITLSVFALFSLVYLKEPITLNHAVGFAFIVIGAGIVFRGPF